MNKGRITFIFLAGFWLHEVMAHLWLSVEGLIPFTSKLFGFTITTQMNAMALAINFLLLLIFMYLGFLYTWEQPAHTARHA